MNSGAGSVHGRACCAMMSVRVDMRIIQGIRRPTKCMISSWPMSSCACPQPRNRLRVKKRSRLIDAARSSMPFGCMRLVLLAEYLYMVLLCRVIARSSCPNLPLSISLLHLPHLSYISPLGSIATGLSSRLSHLSLPTPLSRPLALSPSFLDTSSSLPPLLCLLPMLYPSLSL